jgi:amino acid adenylation domain-containing protein
MRQPAVEGFQLSPQQKRVWRLQNKMVVNPYYVRGAISIEGSLDAEILKRALAAVIQGQEILRTAFRAVPGLAFPVQAIDSGNSPSLEFIEFQKLPSETDTAAIRRVMESVPPPSFDVGTGPAVYWKLVRLSPDHHLLLVDASALCADSRSIGLITEELGRSYDRAQPAAADETETPIQYADIAQWQNELLDAEAAQAVFSHWQGLNLSDATNLTLPLETRHAADFKPRSVRVELSAETRSGIARVRQRLDASAPNFLLACWCVLMRRLTGVADLVVGACCDGRTYEELEHAVGPLARYVPVSAAMGDEITFPELLTAVGSSFQQAVERQEYFLWDRIVPQAGNDSRFFPVTFTFEERRVHPSAGGAAFRFVESGGYIDRSKLDLKCIQTGDDIALELRFDSNVLAEENVQRWAENLEALFADIAAHPEAAVADLDVISKSERDRLIFDFNDTQVPSTDARCAHEWIAENAVLKPNDPAVAGENQSLSYFELNARANQLAHHLRGKGVGPDVPVAICCERSVEMIVSMLAVLKAGGAYVPLSPTYPKDRLQFMLEDSAAPVLLTTERLLGLLPTYTGCVVLMDSHWNAVAGESTAQPERNVDLDNLAYMIYTSGSTGKPKGVEVRHGNLSHSTRARQLYYRDPVGRFLLLSPVAFDSSVAGLFWTLCSGGTLVLPPDGAEQDPAQIVALLERQQVTHTLTLPSLYGRLLSEARPEQLRSLRLVVVAGEACPAEIIDRHHKLVSHAGLFNEYGPTEGTVWSTVYKCSDTALAHVPIGKPIPNVQAYILDAQQKPVPLGVAAELHIGGSGLARGYRNRPDLTRDRFVPNPFGRNGDRLYRTGDLARFSPDGNIEFLGRTDQQVKIRGYRIELEEIESVLARDPDVAQVAVAARNHNGEDRIVAYIVPRPSRLPTTSDLRDALSKQLPDYMIPSVFVMIDALPVSPNGKVDRNALPEPDHVRPHLRQSFVAPGNAVEGLLAEIWADALDVETVGIHDNFLELGGHSILATRLVSQMRDMLQVDLPLRSLFENPTVAQLAEVILRNSEDRSRIEKTAQLALQVVRASDGELETMLREKTGRP